MMAIDETRGGVLFALAHPDDEAFGMAGTLTLLRRAGVPVTLVTATRGEAGEILVPGHATPATLGAVREQELRVAMALAGVDDIRLLGHRDSGMAGTPENDDPRAYINAPDEEVVAQIAAVIRSVRPAAIVTFGADGIYGHPDHIAIHHHATAAATLAADPSAPAGLGEPWQVDALYYAALPRERVRRMAQRQDGPFRSLTPEQLEELGTPAAEITITMPVADVVEHKERVIRAHRTQIDPKGPFAGIDREQVRTMMSWEFLRRVDLPDHPGVETAPDPIATLFAERRPDIADVMAALGPSPE
ncbi:MAG TPA: PIG-L family deacetylase [Thermomicrobiales bacterium]|jgi:N-acetyl-1-D-myo-inositol-2-amino-2-deoxy-alpha-D-glucopyranoside deacetylase|nr:PIG-L family deacetylase [Thermomicrobiales bacterium]